TDVMRIPASHTGRALLDAENPAPFGLPNRAGGLDAGSEVRDAGGAPYGGPLSIEIHGAREHNLKNVDVNLALNQFTVITGVSGSGKSTLAFDILFAEGQRRYLESLNAYARQFVQPASRPDVDAIFGIPPTVAIEQRTSRGGRKSTVATLSEIYHFLRLLYVKLGVQYCPTCSAAIEPQSADAIAARLLRDYKGKRIALLAPGRWISARGWCTCCRPRPPGSRCSRSSGPVHPAAGASPSLIHACSRSIPATAGASAATAPVSRCRASTRSKV